MSEHHIPLDWAELSEKIENTLPEPLARLQRLMIIAVVMNMAQVLLGLPINFKREQVDEYFEKFLQEIPDTTESGRRVREMAQETLESVKKHCYAVYQYAKESGTPDDVLEDPEFLLRVLVLQVSSQGKGIEA